jgi:hypothetical protein
MVHLVQLHQYLHENNVKAKVAVISFVPAARLSEWLSHALDVEMPTSWRSNTRFISDPGLDLYHRYGLGRNSRLKVYGPRIMLHYALRFVRGKGIPKVVDDPLQRGGDFVVDRAGRIALSYVGRDQADRPSAREIVAALS